MGLCIRNQTCINFGYPNNALEYVLLDGILLESKTSWTTNAQTAVRLVRHPHILIGAQTTGRSLLFKEGVVKLSTWMHQNDCTDPELTYWIEKYLLFRGTRSFASLVKEGGFGSQDVWLAAVSQDLIGWARFLHGKVSVEIALIEQLHCMSSPSCRLTGKDWMKAFISLLLQISHYQLFFRKYTLHDKQRGYLRLRLRSEVLCKIHELLETTPSDVLPESQYLLELDHSTLYNASYEDRAYWVWHCNPLDAQVDGKLHKGGVGEDLHATES